MLKKFPSLMVIVCFFLTSLGPLPKAHADSILDLPAPGTMVNLSPAYQPVMIKGLTVHKDNPFLFDFIVDIGQDRMSGDPLKKESEKLIRYFLASLAIPDRDLWVNLSPYEKNRMVPEALGQTDMGRDLLEQDYVLKQITASLIYPEKNLGKKFWDKVYSKAQEMYGTTQIPVNTFNKVWIMADKAEVLEHNQTAFVSDCHLKVMLEEDYLALQKHNSPSSTHSISSQMIRQIILPELEKEVNTGKNFSNLRQIFNSVILSSWYKNNLKEALLNQVYANKSKVKGINLKDPAVKEEIYQQYLKAYKKGVFNYIKEDINTASGETLPRKYFSGGFREGAASKPFGEELYQHLGLFEGLFGRSSLVKELAGFELSSLPASASAAMNAAVLPRINPTTTPSWSELERLHATKKYDLRTLFADNPQRAEELTVQLNGDKHLDVDFSKNLIDDKTLKTLLGLADDVHLKESIDLMFNGAKINETENRAVLHTALRNLKRDAAGELVAARGPVMVDGQDVMPQVIEVLKKMEGFTQKVRSGQWLGASGKPITDVVNIGIGGSDLGPKMAAEALTPYGHDSKVRVHFLSNIDGTAFADLVRKQGLNPETTLFVIASKTLTTQETIQNAETAKEWVLEGYKNTSWENSPTIVEQHFVADSTATDEAKKFGINPQNMFEFWDWVGGRYSLWSAIGLTLATYIGFDNFLELLEGAYEADEHFRTQPFRQNIPVLKALLNVWYGNFLGAESYTILPYDQNLSLLPAFAQQLSMESNGKSIDRNGDPVTYPTGLIVWGAAGTDGQHSFYQLIHQGTRLVPADFIGILKSNNPIKGHHNKLFSNFVAQTEALAFGATLEEVKTILSEDPNYKGENLDWDAPHRTFAGNKPTNSILIDQVTPRTLGNLISIYENQTFAEGIIWNIFSFDQWGVQLGKTVAGKVLKSIKNPQEISRSGLSSSGQRAVRRFVEANGLSSLAMVVEPEKYSPITVTMDLTKREPENIIKVPGGIIDEIPVDVNELQELIKLVKWEGQLPDVTGRLVFREDTNGIIYPCLIALIPKEPGISPRVIVLNTSFYNVLTRYAAKIMGQSALTIGPNNVRILAKTIAYIDSDNKKVTIEHQDTAMTAAAWQLDMPEITKLGSGGINMSLNPVVANVRQAPFPRGKNILLLEKQSGDAQDFIGGALYMLDQAGNKIKRVEMKEGWQDSLGEYKPDIILGPNDVYDPQKSVSTQIQSFVEKLGWPVDVGLYQSNLMPIPVNRVVTFGQEVLALNREAMAVQTTQTDRTGYVSAIDYLARGMGQRYSQDSQNPYANVFYEVRIDNNGQEQIIPEGKAEQLSLDYQTPAIIISPHPDDQTFLGGTMRKNLEQDRDVVVIIRGNGSCGVGDLTPEQHEWAITYLQENPEEADLFWKNLKRSNAVYAPYVKQWQESGVPEDVIARKTVVQDVDALRKAVQEWKVGDPVSPGLHEIATRLIRKKETLEEKAIMEKGVKGKMHLIWADLDTGLWPPSLGNAPQEMIDNDQKGIEAEKYIGVEGYLQQIYLKNTQAYDAGEPMQVFTPDSLDNHPHHQDVSTMMAPTLRNIARKNRISVAVEYFLAAWAGDYNFYVHYGEDVAKRAFPNNHNEKFFKQLMGILAGELTTYFGGKSPTPEQMGGAYAERVAFRRVVPKNLPGLTPEDIQLIAKGDLTSEQKEALAGKAVSTLTSTNDEVRKYSEYVARHAHGATDGNTDTFHFISEKELPKLKDYVGKRGMFIDIGGSTVRVGYGEVEETSPGKYQVRTIDSQEILLTEDQIKGSGRAKLRFIAEQTREFIRTRDLKPMPAVDIFSFANNDGVILEEADRSKDFNWKDVIGESVHGILNEDINDPDHRVKKTGNDTREVAIIGDGVGGVNGTGFNIFSIFLKKLFNTELGNPDVPQNFVTAFYRRLSLGRPIRNEDVIAGKYLGTIAKLVLTELINNGLLFNRDQKLPDVDSKDVNHYDLDHLEGLRQFLQESWGITGASETDLRIIAYTFDQIITQSQSLAATLIHGSTREHPKTITGEKIDFPFDGSVFKTEGYVEGLNDQLRNLGSNVEVRYDPGATQKGAIVEAIAADTAMTVTPAYIAADIGGTKIEVAVVDGNTSEILYSDTRNTSDLKGGTPAEFFDNVAGFIQTVESNAKRGMPDIEILPFAGIGSPGRYIVDDINGGKKIADGSAANLGNEAHDFDGINAEQELSRRLPGVTVKWKNDAVAQMRYFRQYLRRHLPKIAQEIEGQKVAGINPGTGLGGAFDDEKGDEITDGHIYDLKITNEPQKLAVQWKDKTLKISLNDEGAESLFSGGNAIASIMTEFNKAAAGAGAELPFTYPEELTKSEDVFAFFKAKGGKILNAILEKGDSDTHFMFASAIAEFEGRMLALIVTHIYDGDIEKTTEYASWPKGDKDLVKGTKSFLLGGSMMKGKFGEIVKQAAEEELRTREESEGVKFNLIMPVIDTTRAGVLGAAGFVEEEVRRAIKVNAVTDLIGRIRNRSISSENVSADQLMVLYGWYQEKLQHPVFASVVGFLADVRKQRPLSEGAEGVLKIIHASLNYEGRAAMIEYLTKHIKEEQERESLFKVLRGQFIYMPGINTFVDAAMTAEEIAQKIGDGSLLPTNITEGQLKELTIGYSNAVPDDMIAFLAATSISVHGGGYSSYRIARAAHGSLSGIYSRLGVQERSRAITVLHALGKGTLKLEKSLVWINRIPWGNFNSIARTLPRANDVKVFDQSNYTGEFLSRDGDTEISETWVLKSQGQAEARLQFTWNRNTGETKVSLVDQRTASFHEFKAAGNWKALPSLEELVVELKKANSDLAMAFKHIAALGVLVTALHSGVAKSVVEPPGGIDLRTSRGMQWKISKDGKGVEMNINPATIERIRREGLDSLSAIIFSITPVTSIWPLVGLKAAPA